MDLQAAGWRLKSIFPQGRKDSENGCPPRSIHAECPLAGLKFQGISGRLRRGTTELFRAINTALNPHQFGLLAIPRISARRIVCMQLL